MGLKGTLEYNVNTLPVPLHYDKVMQMSRSMMINCIKFQLLISYLNSNKDKDNITVLTQNTVF